MKINEVTKTLNPPSIDVGDEVKVGKFKNRKAIVKGFKKDDNGQPVLKTTKGDQKLYKPRVSKLIPVKENDEEDHGDATCPNCGGQQQWCPSCNQWTATCCVEYGTCWCS